MLDQHLVHSILFKQRTISCAIMTKEMRPTLQEQRQESDEEDDKDREDTSFNPLVRWREVVTTGLSRQNITILVVFADGQLVVEGSEIRKNEHEELDRKNDENVVDMETGMTVVEGQESVDRELSSEVVVFSTKHLLSHTSTNLGLEIQNGSETEISTFTTLVVFGMLDSTTSTDGVHTGVNIFVEMQTLLRLGDTASSVHEDGVEEIRVTVMQLSANPGQ
jgi:hypothetical protein